MRARHSVGQTARLQREDRVSRRAAANDDLLHVDRGERSSPSFPFPCSSRVSSRCPIATTTAWRTCDDAAVFVATGPRRDPVDSRGSSAARLLSHARVAVARDSREGPGRVRRAIGMARKVRIASSLDRRSSQERPSGAWRATPRCWLLCTTSLLMAPSWSAVGWDHQVPCSPGLGRGGCNAAPPGRTTSRRGSSGACPRLWTVSDGYRLLRRRTIGGGRPAMAPVPPTVAAAGLLRIVRRSHIGADPSRFRSGLMWRAALRTRP